MEQHPRGVEPVANCRPEEWGYTCWPCREVKPLRRMTQDYPVGSERIMFNISGIFSSDQFIAQIAAIIVALLSSVFSGILGGLFGAV